MTKKLWFFLPISKLAGPIFNIWRYRRGVYLHSVILHEVGFYYINTYQLSGLILLLRGPYSVYLFFKALGDYSRMKNGRVGTRLQWEPGVSESNSQWVVFFAKFFDLQICPQTHTRRHPQTCLRSAIRQNTLFLSDHPPLFRNQRPAATVCNDNLGIVNDNLGIVHKSLNAPDNRDGVSIIGCIQGLMCIFYVPE